MLVPQLLFLLLLLEANGGAAQPAGQRAFLAIIPPHTDRETALARANVHKRQKEPAIAHTEDPVPIDTPSTTSHVKTPDATPTSPKSNPESKTAPTQQVANIAHVESPVATSTTPTSSLTGGAALIAHTEVVVTSSSSSPSVSETPYTTTGPTRRPPEPAIAHTETEVPSSSDNLRPHVESPAATTSSSNFHVPYTEQPAPSDTPVVVPTAHTEKPAPSSNGGSSGGGLASAIASAAHGAAGGSSPNQPAPVSQVAGGQASPGESPNEVQPSGPTPTPVAVPAGVGSVHVGSEDVSVSAIPAANGAPSAVVVGAQTAAAGQTLTVHSTPLVVSESDGSLYLHPVTTAAAETSTAGPAAAQVTAVLTEGSSKVTEVFAATTDSSGNLVAVTNVQEASTTIASPSASKGASSVVATSKASKPETSSPSTTSHRASSTSSSVAPSSSSTGGSSRATDSPIFIFFATIIGMATSMLLLT